MKLPEFPVDDQTLALLEQALNPWANGDPEAASTSLESFLLMVSQLAGSDTQDVESVEDGGIQIMRDPQYSGHDLILALVAEIRRTRDGE